MKKHRTIFNLFILAGLIFSIEAYAFRLEPMTASFLPEGEGAAKIFRIENESKEKIAVKIQAFVRQIDAQGKETLVDTRDFKIYPEQISLAASDSRAVRVLYIGKKSLDKEMAYRIVASQLPVSFKTDKKKSGINFLFQFVASVYVSSEKFFPKIQVESIDRVDKEYLKLKLVNKGQKHVLLKNVKLVLKDQAGKDFTVNGAVIETWDSENILSGNRRTLIIKSPLNFNLNKNQPKIEIQDEI